MPIPPRGDPRRPLHLAIRSMRLLGGILVLFATCATVPFVIRAGTGRTAPPWAMLIVLAFYLVPGAGFIVLSIYLARRQAWAVVASICLASMALLVILLALLGLAMFAFGPHADFELVLLVPLSVTLLIAAALGQLIYHLAKSFEAIRIAEPQERGFEPIMARNPNDEIRNPNQ
jgi:hypothetical protein